MALGVRGVILAVVLALGSSNVALAATPAVPSPGLHFGTPSPVAAPQASAQSTPLPTLAIAAATPLPAAVLKPTATGTPAVGATLVVTPAANDGDGATSIAPAGVRIASPGTSVTFTHTITQLGNGNDTKNIVARSSLGWQVAILDSTGTTALADTNRDGVPDSGKLHRGDSREIVVSVAVPPDAAAGAHDVTTVTASSTRTQASPADSASVTDTTTVNTVVKLSLSSSDLSFGAVSPAGEADKSVSGVSSSTDASGSFYIKRGVDGQGGVQVTVSSNARWTGSCWADENSGSSSAISITDGRLEWSLSGGAAWSALKTTADRGCFASRPTGTTTYGFDYRLRVAWTDRPGTVRSVLNFAVTP